MDNLVGLVGLMLESIFGSIGGFIDFFDDVLDIVVVFLDKIIIYFKYIGI